MRKDRHVIQLNEEQQRLCIKAMIEFRNYVIEQDIDTVDIDKLIKMLSKQLEANMTILENFYYGNIDPHEYYIEKNST